MKIGIVQQVWRYPVKSMGGEVLQSVDLTRNGIPGDRAWAVRDEVRGGIRGAKVFPALMTLNAHYGEPPALEGSSPASITFADGSVHSTTDEGINQQLSEVLGHEVTLWPLVPAEMLDHYRRGEPVHEDLETELRAMLGREPGEPLPDIGLFPPKVAEFASPPGTYFDAFPLLLLSDASLEEMERRAEGSSFDVRRFRPNLLISETASSTPFPEMDWRGRRLRVGEAILEVTIECPRCVMVTHGFEDLPADAQIMRSLVREAGGSLGVYATIVKAGAVRSGDAVDLLPEL